MSHPATLTPEQVQFFYDNGYLVVRNAIPMAIIEQLREGAEQLEERFRDYREDPGVYYTTPKATSFEEMMNGAAARQTTAVDERVLWRVDNLDEHLPQVAALKSCAFVHNAMQALLGDEILQYNEAYVTKPPRIGQTVHWHQDPSFKVKKAPDPIATCDVYLDYADEENGCLWVIPGSHKHGVIDVAPLVEKHGFDLPGAIPVRMSPGDVAFHDNGTLHGSKENKSDRYRRIVYLAFQTVRQARLADVFDEEFITKRREAFDAYRRIALGNK